MIACWVLALCLVSFETNETKQSTNILSQLAHRTGELLKLQVVLLADVLEAF